jgi:hypothetical protein
MTTETQQAVVLTLPRPPSPPLSENASRTLHWAARNRRLRPWGDEFGWLLKGHRAAIQAMDKPVTVELTLRFRNVRIRDPHNLVGTVLKEIIDSAVRTGCLPDDNPLYVRTVEPILLVDKTDQSVTLTITPASHALDITEPTTSKGEQ